MPTFNPAWDAAWTTTSINSTSIVTAANSTTAAISSSVKIVTEVSIAIAYAGTATEGVKIYVLRDIDGTNYETVNDMPWGFQMPFAASVTRYRTFTLSGVAISKFKILVSNASGGTVTATVRFKQATFDLT